jgi:uncharacterized surface protein with fasciclin (FAS1) repeats
MNSCNLVGYDLQENNIYTKTVIDPQTNKTVMAFMQSRPDLFSSMLQAIQYTKLDTLYSKTGNTYLLLTNYALSDLTNTNSYFRLNKVPNPALPVALISGSAWRDYDTTKIREFLKYHVVKGIFNYMQLTANQVWTSTYATGDSCKMGFVLTNDRYSSLFIQNNLYNAAYESVKPRTSGLECTNSGAVHVMDKYINPPSRFQLGLK